MTKEVRFTPASRGPVRVEKRADGKRTISGYAAVFYREEDPGTEYQLWPGLVERIMPGAFDRALKELDDALATYNHSTDTLLGRVSAGTLRLRTDKQGLLYEIDEDPDDPDHQRVIRKMERGDLTGSSFGFIAQKAVWIEETDREIRQIEQVELLDVGPVARPAYQATTAGVRSEDLDEARQAHKAWKDSRAEDQALEDEIEMRCAMIERGIE